MNVFLGRFKITAKILALLGLLGAICLAVALYGRVVLTDTDAKYSELLDHHAAATIRVAKIRRLTAEIREAGFASITYEGSSQLGRDSAQHEKETYATAKKLLVEVQELRPDVAEQMGEFSRTLDEVHNATVEVIALGLQNRNAEATARILAARAVYNRMEGLLGPFVDKAIAASDKDSAQMSVDVVASSRFSLIISLFGVVMALVIGFFVARAGVTQPLGNIERQMRRLADGDNSMEIPDVARRDEIGLMARALVIFRDNARAQKIAADAKAIADAEQQKVVATLADSLGKLAAGDLTATINTEFSADYAVIKSNFNEAVTGLRTLIGSVLESTATIRSGSGEISQASEDLARRTEANAASLEETSAAVTQIDGRLKASAQSASRTVERADGAIGTVANGRTIADEAVQAMTRVSDSAEGIDGVIEGLDKIAFQTRVLAMNAAVEAGRAGEAGRGFAVVADLVSALAMRAEEEAGRARGQLTATQTDIVAAVDMVQKVDAALANISGDVSEVHSLLGQMAADNEAQSTAISQISVAIGTMDQATQQNAAMVEETSAAARNLNAEVLSLADQAAQFNVGTETRASARPAKAQPQPAAKKAGYVSPVKALPVAAMAGTVAQGDWASF